MANLYNAPAPSQTARPAYQIEVLEGTHKVMKTKWDKEAGKMVQYEAEVPNGFLVTFRKGHSIRVADEAELKRLNCHAMVPLVDDEGDQYGVQPSVVVGPAKRPGAGATVSK